MIEAQKGMSADAGREEKKLYEENFNKFTSETFNWYYRWYHRWSRSTRKSYGCTCTNQKHFKSAY